MTNWRNELKEAIEQVAMKIHDNAQSLADQPDYMTGDFKILITINQDIVPTYTVTHTHF